jgi:hypothetical protein
MVSNLRAVGSCCRSRFPAYDAHETDLEKRGEERLTYIKRHADFPDFGRLERPRMNNLAQGRRDAEA